MIVLFCPSCRVNSIGDDGEVIQCHGCKTIHDTDILRQMVEFARQPWIRSATDAEEYRERLLLRAEAFERVGRRCRIMAREVQWLVRTAIPLPGDADGRRRNRKTDHV